MNRSRIVLGGVLAILAIAVGIALVDNRVYAMFVARKLQQEAANSGVTLVLSKPRLTFVGLSAEEATVQPRGVPLSFQFSSLRSSLPIASLLAFEPRAVIHAEAYSGTVDGDLILTDPESPPKLSGNSLVLSQHPQILGLGITSGTLSFSVTPKEKGALNVSLKMKDVNKPGTLPLKHFFPTSPLPITLPPIANLNLSADAQIDPASVQIRGVTLTSSLLSLTIDGSIALSPKRKVTRLKLSGTGEVHEEGKEAIGPLVSLLSSGKLKSSESQAFRFEVEGSPSRPRYEVVPAG